MPEKKLGGRPPLPPRVRMLREVEALVSKLVNTLTKEVSSRDKILLDLENTPKRVAKALVDELLSAPKLTVESFAKYDVTSLSYNGVVMVGPIDFTSMCSHHMLPFYGQAYIGILPEKYVLGLSKYAKIVDGFSRRLQLQEKLGSDILSFICEAIEPSCAVVKLCARHTCMCSRGVKQANAWTVTSHIHPALPEARPVVEEIQRFMESHSRR